MIEDDLDWLTEHRYEVAISKHGDRWHVMLLGEHDSWEMGGTSFDSPPDGDLVGLLAHAREWAEEPLAGDLNGRDWLRLCEAAARLGVPARNLIRQGARELLDRLDREHAGPENGSPV